jgi:hypothetical protein
MSRAINKTNYMKRIIGLLIMFCVSACCAFAQQNGVDRISVVSYADKGSKEANYMKDSLGLTTAQTVAADSVLRCYLRKIALLEGQALTAAQRAQAILDAAANRDTGLQAILTNQQYNNYKSMLQANETRLRARLRTN